MIGNISLSALAAAAAECADRDSVTKLFAGFLESCGVRYAFAYRFDSGLKAAADRWTPLYVSFPAEIIDYYRSVRFAETDSLARAAFSSYLPVRFAEIAAGFDQSEARRGLHALFDKYGVKDILAMHVADRPGRVVYIALAYDRLLDGVGEFERRRLHSALEMFMRHASGVLERKEARGELSPKERDVLRLLAGGASNKEIARTLGISLSTVNTLVNRCFDKLGAHTRTEAVIAAARAGLALVA